jgi:hypothetical protein
MKQACTLTLVAALSCAVVDPAAAQPAAEAGVAECAAIESGVARLDCFDALARQLRVTEPERVVAAPPAAPEPAARPQRRDARAADREEREQVSQVAALREIQPGRVEVTLANGEVWRQTNSDRYNLLVGHEVKIYPTGFGRYFRLSSTEARGFIQVERVR